MVYTVYGIINVNMYASILSPEVTLDEDREITEERWDKFDAKKYEALICERAVIELKKLLQRLPEKMRCAYVEGSAHILSPKFYNCGGDVLCFSVECQAETTETKLQNYLDNFFSYDWEAEFEASYRIYEYIAQNYSVESFPAD